MADGVAYSPGIMSLLPYDDRHARYGLAHQQNQTALGNLPASTSEPSVTIRDTFSEARGKMTGQEFTKIQKTLAMSDADLAAELGVNRSTVWRWRTGQQTVERLAEFAMLWLQSRAKGRAAARKQELQKRGTPTRTGQQEA